MLFEALVVACAVAGGVVASVTGFGIGSLLTPALAWQMDTRIAVAAVSIPHFIGTAFRFWLLGGGIDRRVLWSFGVMSAVGGLSGALLQEWSSTPALMVLFGALLLFTAGAELTGLARRLQFQGPFAWMAGAASGMLGGLVGNQGGIRSAALLGVDLPKHAFVATATAVGLMVDAARVPVYLWYMAPELNELRAFIALAAVGVVAGTIVGNRLLAGIPERTFRRVVAIVLALLGATMAVQGLRGG